MRFGTMNEFVGSVSEFLARFDRVATVVISAEIVRVCTLTTESPRVN